MAEQQSFGFNLELKDIKSVTQGKHGIQTNVLEVTALDDNQYRVIVKDYNAWNLSLLKH